MKDGFKIHLFTSYALLLICFSCTDTVDQNASKSVFRYNQSGGLTSLDPAFASSQANIWVCTQLFDGLVELDQDLKVRPALAKKWEVSEDGTEYKFTIRKDVFFHEDKLFKSQDERLVTAYDFEYSLKRIIDTNSIYNKGIWVFKDKVLRSTTGALSDTCFRAVNDSLFVIHLDHPVANFLEILAMPYAFVVPEKIAEHYGKDFRKHPVGTGAFKFFYWEEGNSLVLHKNEAFWKSGSNNVKLPFLDAVQLSFVPDKSQAYREFLMGELDYFSGIDQSSVDEVLNLDGSFNRSMLEKYSIQKCGYLNTEYLGFQLDSNASCYRTNKEKPFLNKEFRKALSWSIDREKMVRFVKNNLGTPGLYGFVPPAVPNFDERKCLSYGVNKDSALFYLQKSGVSTDDIVLDIHITKEHRGLTEFIAKQWEESIGVKVDIKIHEAGVLRQMANNGEVACFRASWLGDYPDAENYLGVFYGSNFAPNGPNKTHFVNNEFDRCYEKLGDLREKQARKDLTEHMDRLIMQEAPVLILYYDEVIQLTSKCILDLPINGMNVLKLDNVKKTCKSL